MYSFLLSRKPVQADCLLCFAHLRWEGARASRGNPSFPIGCNSVWSVKYHVGIQWHGGPDDFPFTRVICRKDRGEIRFRFAQIRSDLLKALQNRLNELAGSPIPFCGTLRGDADPTEF